MSFRMANVWKSFDNSKFSNGKIDKKSFFSRKGRELDELKSSVCVDVEVVFALRPSSRLCLEESYVNSTLQRLQAISLTFGP